MSVKDPQVFASYHSLYHTTICGRHAIGILLNVSLHPISSISLFPNKMVGTNLMLMMMTLLLIFHVR